jgi:hypothetical protein
MAKWADSLKSKLFGAVTRIESSLTVLSHLLDQCYQAQRQFRLLSLIIHIQWKEVFLRPLRCSVSINKEPLLHDAFPAAL